MDIWNLALAAVLGLLLLGQLLLLWRTAHLSARNDAADLQILAKSLQDALASSERNLHAQIQLSAQAGRQDALTHFTQFQHALSQQMSGMAQLQRTQFDSFATQLSQLGEQQAQHLVHMRSQLAQQEVHAREELANTLKRLNDSLQNSLQLHSESNTQRLNEIRTTLEQKLQRLQEDNGQRLEEMRRTVDEKLHATLEQRLGESFKLVSERLEKVHQGLGEMQQLAIGVGDLKRVLTNVKTRGTWGEVQLEMVLEQLLTSEQYSKNVEVVPGSNERVEFAIRLPGREGSQAPCWIPIDAKFPKEQYERLQEASERADAEGVAQAQRELERVLRGEAKTIAEKYLSPPLTTDFAILFLPTEGLYAEAMRRPGLADALQREYRVCLTGPSTLSALLNSLQMGFRTLVLEKRSSEVWQVLGAVKTEFGKFGDVLAATKSALERVTRNIDQAEVRTRQMNRKLKSVEALPGEAAHHLLELDAPESD